MKKIMPRFYREFKCIAGACTDSCCIGWEIDIDEESYARYAAHGGEFGQRLRKDIVVEEGTKHFCLKEKERCAFLNNDNLCDIYIHMGEDALCDICREHPRFYEWFGSRVEAGLGLCCEEACRLLLADEAPLTFVEEQDDDPDEVFEGDETWLQLLEDVRKDIFEVLQDRNELIEERLWQYMQAVGSVQDEMDGFGPLEEYEVAIPTDEQLLALCKKLEPIDETWTQRVNAMETAQDRAYDLPDWQIEHVMVYLTYRWLLKGAFDGDALGKGRLAILFVRLMQLLLRKGAVKNAEEALRILSKEIEYSEENTALCCGWEA